jgi:hypothetical protein
VGALRLRRSSVTALTRCIAYAEALIAQTVAGDGLAEVALTASTAHLDDTLIVEQPLRVPLADDGITHRLRVRLG